MNKRNQLVNGYSVCFVQNDTNLDSNKITLVFVHGNSSSKTAFSKQLEDPRLSEKYNLIAIDLPGHGESEHIPEAEHDTSIYTVPFYAETVNTFLKEKNIENVIAVGHSLGAHVTTRLSKLRPLKGLINIQNTPINTPADVAGALSQDQSFQQLFNPDVTDMGIQSLAKKFFATKAPDYFYEDFRKSDPKCRKNLVHSLVNGIILDEIEYLKNIKIPFKLIIGIKDSFTNYDYVAALDLGNKVEYLETDHYPMLDKNGDTFFKIFQTLNE